MTKTIHAICEHVVLRPLEPIDGNKENTPVEITVSIEKKGHFTFCRHSER